MGTNSNLAVTSEDALSFFFQRLRTVSGDGPPQPELLYNASVLAHFASTSISSAATFPAAPASLSTVFDVFVLDCSQHADPTILEAAGAQCLFLTGFLGAQQRARHNLSWYSAMGAGYFASAGQLHRDRNRSKLMWGLAERFDFWREAQATLASSLSHGQLAHHAPRRAA